MVGFGSLEGTVFWDVSTLNNSGIKNGWKLVDRRIRGTYFDPVALVVMLLRGDAVRVESFGWALDAVKADPIPIAVVSDTKRRKNIMTKSGQMKHHHNLHLEELKEVFGKMHGQCGYQSNLMGISVTFSRQVHIQTLTHLASGGRAS